MVTLGMLWLPILVATVVAFIVGAILWMVSPHHRRDFRPLSNEDAVADALRQGNPAPGQYMLPYIDPKQMNDPTAKAKMAQGPVGILMLRPPGDPAMGKQLVQQFLYHFVITAILAYLASWTLGFGSAYAEVFCLIGTAGVLAYVGALVPSAIWFGRPWGVVARDAFDGVVWALVTAGVFGWLWPR